MPHPIVHLDIPAVDPKQSAEFYGKLFDWNIAHEASFDYYMFAPEPGPGGGFVKVDKPATPRDSFDYAANSVLIYVDSDDIEATLARAESLGAKTLRPKEEIPGIGWWAVFSDPSGNSIGLFTDVSMQQSK